jgi:hypothetical protein
MNAHWGVLLDWTLADVSVLGIAIQQYISISRDIKRSKAKEEAETSAAARHPEGQQSAHQG